MSVIIRLQNLPWSANALDIRQFFKGLSIPEGGVHIVGGEMGDAFIAFSTDEDARQAMMKDRGKLNEVQIRLLLSSRAEMQKVIETARQQSILALQKAGAIPATVSTTPLKSTPLATPQPPVITANSLQNILGTQLGVAPSFQTYQQQAGITLIPTPDVKTENTETKISTRRESNESLSTRDRRRSTSRERRRSRSRDRSERSRRRRERSRSRERDRDRKSGRQRSSRRSRSRDHSRDRTHNGGINSRGNRERQRSTERINENKNPSGNEAKSVKSPYNTAPTNEYESSIGQISQKINPLNIFGTAAETGLRTNISNAYTTSPSIHDKESPKSSAAATLPLFQNFSTTTSTTNNYSINLLSNSATTNSADALKPTFALQNPYTAALKTISSNSNSQDSNSSSIFSSNAQQSSTEYPGVALDKKSTSIQQSIVAGITGASPQNPFAQQSPQQQTTTQQQSSLTQQQPIAFANTNPYAQMYPNLFAQAAAAGTGIGNPSRSQSAKPQDPKFSQRSGGGSNDYKGSQRNSNDDDNDNGKSCSIKISDMCSSTTYSDLRKFFSGLFIPHNGIKMINDREGLRTGVAYIQFSRSSCVAKAIIRNNTFLKTKRVVLEPVTDEEFQDAEDSYKPHRDNYNRFNRNEIYDNGNRGLYDNRFDNRNSSMQGRNDISNSDNNSLIQQFSSKGSQEPITVLYIEDIPAMATEHDIMKMFSAFTIFDILLTVSPGNRREFTAYVKFSREDEAKSALLEQSRHVIGHRKVRVRPARAEEMEKAKEKLRLANEQLKKEEAALHSDDNEDYCNEDNGEVNAEDVDDELTIIENNTEISDSRNSDGNLNDRSNKSDLQTSEDFKRTKDGPSDPRLRRQKNSRFSDNTNNESMPQLGADANSSFLQNMGQFQNIALNSLNVNKSYSTPAFASMNNMEQNFIILKNCDYNTRINDVAQLLLSANLNLKHIEPLRNDRQMPSGEFIVEFTNSQDATTALNRFNNTMFLNRNLRVRDITPQEIADRIGKPFMNYFPGGGGRNGGQSRGNFDLSGRGPPPNFRVNGGLMDGMDRSRFDNMNNRNRGSRMDGMGCQNFISTMRGGDGGGSGGAVSIGGGNRDDHTIFNSQDIFTGGDVNPDIIDCDNENPDKSDYDENDEVVSVSSNGHGGVEDNNSSIPEKFNRPGCVLALENVPFKADLKDIIEFFGEFDVKPDDIIRRFNDDGSPTGDARVAFPSSPKARAAFEAKRQHTIFNRTIFMSTL